MSITVCYDSHIQFSAQLFHHHVKPQGQITKHWVSQKLHYRHNKLLSTKMKSTLLCISCCIIHVCTSHITFCWWWLVNRALFPLISLPNFFSPGRPVVILSLGFLPGIKHLKWFVYFPEFVVHLTQGLIATEDHELSWRWRDIDTEIQKPVCFRELRIQV